MVTDAKTEAEKEKKKESQQERKKPRKKEKKMSLQRRVCSGASSASPILRGVSLMCVKLRVLFL